MPKYFKKTNSRIIFFEYVLNRYYELDHYICDGIFTENLSPQEKEQYNLEYDEQLLKNLKKIYETKEQKIINTIQELPEIIKLNFITINILQAAYCEFLLQGQEHKGLVIKEYLKITDLFNEGNGPLTNALLNKLFSIN